MRHVLTFGFAFALAACGGKSKGSEQPAGPDKPLFERLGGQPAINAVVHEFVAMTGADPRINMFFTNVDIPKLEKAMDDHICSITGGGCTYAGKSMLDAHTNMKVLQKDFDAFMDDLDKTLTKLDVPAREKGEVLGAFRGVAADVVGH